MNVTPPVLTVTVAAPPGSAIAAGSAVTTHAGSSSSVIISIASAGAAILGPSTVPDIITCLSGSTTVSFIAVIVTVPPLSVAPAANLNVRFALRVKSSGCALANAAADAATASGRSGAGDTVTANAEPDGGDTVARTRLTPPFSEISSGDTISVSTGCGSGGRSGCGCGGRSSSVIVTVG